MKAGLNNITAITAVCNTLSLIERMYSAFRKFHPDIELIIVDNSDTGHPCREYLHSIASLNTHIFLSYGNLGHAKALHFAIGLVKTKYAILMDSDTVMLKSPLVGMLRLLKEDTYGVGWITEIGRDGYDFGTFKTQREPVKYLHPYFCLINVAQYKKYMPLIHHGNPFTKTMIQLHDLNLSHKLVPFPGLTGHTTGKGSNWVGTPSEYVQHDFGGTRMELRKAGRQEIEGKWES